VLADVGQAAYALVLVAFLAVSGIAIWKTMASSESEAGIPEQRELPSLLTFPEPARRVPHED
jgi:hypothetical protein